MHEGRGEGLRWGENTHGISLERVAKGTLSYAAVGFDGEHRSSFYSQLYTSVAPVGK